MIRHGFYTILFCLLGWFYLSVPAWATPRWSPLASTPFQHWSVEQGLPHPNVTALLEDQSGFIWIGTQGGLARWDGYRFRVFQFHPDRADSLPDSFIHSLHRDRQGELWVGTGNAGLARYDPLTESFERVGQNAGTTSATIPDTTSGTIPGSVLSLADAAADLNQDHQPQAKLAGGLWIGARGGLTHMNLATGKATLFQPQSKEGNDLPSNIVRALARDKLGRLWLGTDHGLFYRDQSAGAFTALALPLAKAAAYRVLSLSVSRDGHLWVGTDGHGTYLIGPDAGPDARPKVQASIPNMDDDLVFCIREIDADHIWLSTLGHGVVVLDRASMQTKRLRHDASLATSLANDSVWALLRDRSGLIWVGSNEGLSRHDPNQNAILTLLGAPGRANALADIDVYSVLPMPDGKIWLGLANQGVNIVDAKAGQLRWLAPDVKQPERALPPHPVNQMLGPVGGWVYLGTQRGLYRADSQGRRVELLNLAPRVRDSAVRALASVSANAPSSASSTVSSTVSSGGAAQSSLWLGGADGLWQVDLAGDGSVHAHRVAMAQGLDQQLILTLEVAADGVLWIGTRDAGIARFDPKSGSLRQFLPQPNRRDGMISGAVTSFLFDRSGHLWVATLGGGIVRLRQPNGGDDAARFERIGIAQGLNNQLVNKLLEDRQGRIWVSTDGGLAMIDPATLKVHTLQRADGILFHNFWNGAGARTEQGELLFGGAGGLVVLRPDSLQPWRYQAPLAVTQLQLGGQTLAVGRFNEPAGPGALGTRKITVQPQANSLALEFASLDYSAPERNRYGYWLEGYDANWIEGDATRRLAAYTNLPVGDYRLHLRVSNRNGQWSPAQQIIPIRVLAAWHQTLWFRALMLVFAVALVWALVQMRTRVLRKRQYALVTQVRQRTNELRIKKQELKAANKGLARTVASLHQAQAQLVEQEKLAALGALVTGVAHEINTPLGTALVAMSGVKGVWQRLRQALALGSLSKSTLETSIDEGCDYTELALNTGSRAAGLITSFKEIAVCFENEETVDLDLSQYLQEMATLVRATLEPAGHTLTLQVPEGLHLRLVPEALTETLTRIFANVMDHAFVAGGAGQVWLRAEQKGDEVMISVRDNGVGIAAQHLAKVFDPFFTTQRGKHIGLGLHVAYNQVVQRLRGQISISSEVGQGTTVTVRLGVF